MINNNNNNMNKDKIIDIYYTLKNIRDLHNLLLSKDKKVVKQAIERLADYNSIINADMLAIHTFLKNESMQEQNSKHPEKSPIYASLRSL